MKRTRAIIIRLVVLLIVGAAAWGAYAWFSNDAGEKPALRTARVERGDLEVTAQSSGKVEADLTVEVKSRASGEVVELRVVPGDVVKAGDLLVRLDPVDEDRNVESARMAAASSEARLAQARAALASARTNAAEVRERFERRRRAFASGLISAEELRGSEASAAVADRSVEQREADLASARADVTRSRLAIEETVRRREETVIRAPVDATVLSVNVDRGAIIASGISNVGGGTTLLTLADLSRLLVSVKLDEAQIGAVRKGQEARIRVDAHPEIVFRGAIERVSPLGITEGNIVTFDIRVLITDPRARLLKPGMSTDVEIVTEHRENVLMLPSAALRRLPAQGRGGGRREAARTGTETPAADPTPENDGTRTARREPEGSIARQGSSAGGARDGQARENGRRRTRSETGVRERPEREAESGSTDGRRDLASSEQGTQRDIRERPVDRLDETDRDRRERAPVDAEAPAELPRRAPRQQAVVELTNGDTRIVTIGPSNGRVTVIEEGLEEGVEVVIPLVAARTSGGVRGPATPFTPTRRR